MSHREYRPREAWPTDALTARRHGAINLVPSQKLLMSNGVPKSASARRRNLSSRYSQVARHVRTGTGHTDAVTKVLSVNGPSMNTWVTRRRSNAITAPRGAGRTVMVRDTRPARSPTMAPHTTRTPTKSAATCQENPAACRPTTAAPTMTTGDNTNAG